ncbi:plant virulence effector HPE1-like domain-containing protein [Hoeflea sp. YIM 152468]|uniref:plant virulence effector HPE1-like domain-containing protein n=1 Tax=Hoeflea sp. YIM 152468 TaxID=3031759 RepID=UPI0023DB496F|nr:plant virulence effector HPE1-like domain-containing protein [Hoeflea sp. YIM 152468]MDF1608613.1 plant virulence effector HPE1-like domain-containing protein [Hoeflea sp. YIM 152468]
MLRTILAATFCLGAGAAQASSIEPFQPTASSRSSMITIGCPACVREAAQKAKADTEIKLKPGQIIVEARDVDGEMMIYRTENLLGGSPRTMVRKAREADLIALGLVNDKAHDTASVEAATDNAPATAETADQPRLFEPVIATTAPGIDQDTKTGALGEPVKTAFDPSSFELRLN